jgi:hypothetical protein
MILTPDDIRLFFPGIADDEAQRLCDIVEIAVDAVCCEDIPDPPPAEVKWGALLWASVIHGAPGGSAAIMVSERIGDYSYTTTGGVGMQDVLSTVPANVAPYLMDYLCPGFKTGDAYELTVWPKKRVVREWQEGEQWIGPHEHVD